MVLKVSAKPPSLAVYPCGPTSSLGPSGPRTGFESRMIKVLQLFCANINFRSVIAIFDRRGTRTHHLQLRRLTLYPDELVCHYKISCKRAISCLIKIVKLPWAVKTCCDAFGRLKIKLKKCSITSGRGVCRRQNVFQERQ